MIDDVWKQVQFISATILELFEQVDEEIFHKRPISHKMSVWEVCVHLSQIPGADLHILKGYSDNQMMEYYQAYKPNTFDQVIGHFNKGIRELILYYQTLSTEELDQQFKTHWGSKYSVAEWLIQIVNHLVHHRAQLYQYLLFLNRDVQIVLFR